MDRQTSTRIRKNRTMHKCTYPQCGKAFTKKSNMLIHSRIHTGETPYKCQYIGCGRSYKWLSSINFHQSRCDKKNRGLVSPPHKPPTPPAEAARRAAAAAAATDNTNPLVNLGNPSTPTPPFRHVGPLQQLPSLPSVQSLQLAPSPNPMNQPPQTQVPTMHPPLSLPSHPSHPQYSQHNYNMAMQQSSYTQVPPIQSTINMQSPFHHPNIQYFDTHGGAGPSSITGQPQNIHQPSYTQIQQRQDQEQSQDQQQQQNQQYPPRQHPQQPSFLSIPITQTMDEHSSTARYLQPLPQIQSQQQQPSTHITVEQSGTTVASPPPPPPSSNTNTYGSTDQSQLFHPQRKGRFRTELNDINDNQTNDLNLKGGMTSTTYRAGEDIGTTLAIAAATSQSPIFNTDALYLTKMIFNGKPMRNPKSMIEADTTTTVTTTTASAMDTTLDISEAAKALLIPFTRKDNIINSNTKDSTYRVCNKSHDSWSSTTGKNKDKNFLPKSPESATSKEVRELLAPNAPGIILTGTSEVQTSRCSNGSNRNTELETIGESFRFGDEFFVSNYEIGNEMLDDLTTNSYQIDLDQCSPESESIGVFE